jgi:hypothetical protein
VIKVKNESKIYFKEQEGAYILDEKVRFIIGQVDRIGLPKGIDEQE